ncbi:LysR family transcriptional regulator [Roseiterribacter gracilis]|uniref:LysR family transcriptional regulator n=1 Tax=Roseiterribacter gracilis TaxID=2812848 RepID=A0A8S8XAQ5_9PROT|nr:LysR family transcriptional regulator [Rhodospirillales bacterium TMPK1]
MLSAFEAAARTGSISDAARELALTQSAASRQILALERQLGVQLFIRERQKIRLTPGGEAYAQAVRHALGTISSASLNLRANPSGGTLNLAILPTFGARWLAPRLPAFLAQHPGVTVNLVTRLAYFDLDQERIDAAIHFGRADWPNADSVLLRSEQVLPVCSPDLKAQHPFATPRDLRDATLLHVTSRPDAWRRWFAAQDEGDEPVPGMLFDQFATIAQAAIAGLGVALLPTFLIDDELQRGTLVRALDLPMESAERYYLIVPKHRDLHAPLQAFRDWILSETAADRA